MVLLELGISNDTVDMINALYDEQVLTELESNFEIVKENIDYLKSIGINNINELITTDLTAFFAFPSVVKRKVEKVGIDKFKSLLEEDPNNIDILS